MNSQFHLLLTGSLLCVVAVNGFVQKTSFNAAKLPAVTTKSKTSLSVASVDPEDIESARRLFYLWFFGGSGGGGIALAAFPKMYGRFQDMRSLKGQGPTAGGETIGISPLCGYPEDLKLADVQKIFNNKMSVERMVETGPKDSFWAERGYLRFEAFEAANKNCNPLALRVIFDAMTTSTSTVEPDIAQESLDKFKNDIEVFKKTALASKAKGYSAIGVLLFLLGITAEVAGQALAEGWFPEWPGYDNFPVGLIDPGVWTIKDYWI